MATVHAPVALPDSRLTRDATELIRSAESDLLYHHSLRVYSFGALQGDRLGLSYDPELLASLPLAGSPSPLPLLQAVVQPWPKLTPD